MQLGCGLMLSTDEGRQTTVPSAAAAPAADDSAAGETGSESDAPDRSREAPAEIPAVVLEPAPQPLDPRILLAMSFDGSPYSLTDPQPIPTVEGVEEMLSDGRRGGRFDEDSLVTFTSTDTLSGLSAFTVELWARLDSAVESGRVALADKESEWGIFVFPEDKLRFSAASGGHVFCTIEAERWTHVALVVDRGSARFSGYVDGQHCGSAEAGTAPPSTDDPIHFGSDSPTDRDKLVGMLSDIRFWGVALNEDEVCARASGCED